MKKIIMFAAAAFMFTTNVNADEISIVPRTITSGVDIEAASETEVLTVDFTGDASKNYTSFQFDIHAPKELVFMDTDDCDYAELNTDYLKSKLKFSYTFVKYSSVSPLNANYTTWRVTISSSTSKTVAGSPKMELMTFGYGGDISAGIYPIYVDGIVLSDYTSSKLTKYTEGLSTSYIKVGDAKGLVEFQGQLPSFVNDELAADAAITKVDLSKVTAAAEFTYVAGREVIAPDAAVNAKVNYAGLAPKGNTYASACFPVKATFNAFQLSGLSSTEATFESVSTVEAGTPVIYTTAFSTEAASAQIVAATNETKTTGCYLKGDKFRTVDTNVIIPAGRGWWDRNLSNKRIVVDGTVTNINGISVNENETSYDLQGRRVLNAKNGVYVVNGKKQIVK